MRRPPSHAMNPKLLLPRFDRFLADRGAIFEAIVIGGGALSVMGVITRSTVDFDVLDPKIPDAILKLAHELLEARPWLLKQDAGEEWPKIVEEALAHIAK